MYWWETSSVEGTCHPARAATDPHVSRINARSLEFTNNHKTEVDPDHKLKITLTKLFCKFDAS